MQKKGVDLSNQPTTMLLKVRDPEPELLLFKTAKEFQHEEWASPRGVFDAPVTPVSNTSCDSDGSPSSSLGKALIKKHEAQWRNFVQNVKKKSEQRFSTIPLLTCYDHTAMKIRRKKYGRNQNYEDLIDCGDSVTSKPTWRHYTRSQLAAATDNFSSDNMVGEGGHAEVYKGCLVDGTIVAVKRITKNEKEKDHEDKVRNFLTELGVIAHVDHPNAAKLIGFSIDGGFYLVLEFCTHGSLASLLHGTGGECVEWKIRFKVALGIAQGLEYLHSQCNRRIIHRDITADNILLNEDYEPQISDFGLAKWLPDNWTNHVVHPIEGTFGCMAPEYFMHGIFNEKTDVYAFGVLLLELITGRRAVDSGGQSLVTWAKPLLETSNVEGIKDPRLEDAYDNIQMQRAMTTALACIHHSPDIRPTMTRGVQMLRGDGGGHMETKQKSMGGRVFMIDACDLEGYTGTTYMNDLNRHMQLIME